MSMKRKVIAALLSASMLLITACESSGAKSDNTTRQTSETEIVIQGSATGTSVTSETEAATISDEQTVTSDSKETDIEVTTPPTETTTQSVSAPSSYSQDMTVHFIDVGQGDSIFIELPNEQAMLIDAGENSYGDKVVTYIYSQGYDTLDYVVATHPHSDHIGGMDDVINNFNVGNFYITSSTSTSQTYDDMLNALNNSGAKVHEVMAGDVILNEEDLLIEVVAPKAIDNDNLNNNSIVVKLTYGDRKFLFVGDAEKTEEDGIWTNIKCDVFKIGHHGSKSSSSSNFLKKVEPTYAVISVGLGNSYGHPDDTTLKKLNERNIKTYRTDKQGTVIFKTDGKEISVNISPSEYEPPAVTTTPQNDNDSSGASSEQITYVLNTNTKKIHLPSCSSVGDIKEKNKSFTDDYDGAIAQGYVPCKRCNP